MTDYALFHQPLDCESQFLLMLFMPDLTNAGGPLYSG
jgi:hypothetical protein